MKRSRIGLTLTIACPISMEMGKPYAMTVGLTANLDKLWDAVIIVIESSPYRDKNPDMLFSILDCPFIPSTEKFRIFRHITSLTSLFRLYSEYGDIVLSFVELYGLSHLDDFNILYFGCYEDFESFAVHYLFNADLDYISNLKMIRLMRVMELIDLSALEKDMMQGEIIKIVLPDGEHYFEKPSSIEIVQSVN